MAAKQLSGRWLLHVVSNSASERVNFRQVREFAEIINVTFSFIRQNFKPLGKVIIYIVGPFILVSSLVGGFMQESMLSLQVNHSGSLWPALQGCCRSLLASNRQGLTCQPSFDPGSHSCCLMPRSTRPLSLRSLSAPASGTQVLSRRWHNCNSLPDVPVKVTVMVSLR